MPPADDDLETLIAGELRQLPAPRAPQGLLPRVMAAVGQSLDRPWYARSWFTWPLPWRVASVGAVAPLGYLGWRVPPAPPQLTAAAGAGRVVWDLMVVPLLPYLAALATVMTLACVLVGLALNYVLLERAEQR